MKSILILLVLVMVDGERYLAGRLVLFLLLVLPPPVHQKNRNPLTDRKACSNYVPNSHHPSSNDWHIEISLLKAQPVSSVNSHLKEFGGSCTALAFEKSEDANKAHDVKYDYDPAEDNVECSSMSDLVSGSFETKHVNVDKGNSATLLGLGHRSSTEEVDPEGLRTQECKSLDSTVTDTSSRCMHGCCLHAAGELAFIRKQLLEIETKQSNLLDLLQIKEFLHSGNMESAYAEALCTGDDLCLLELMDRTGPVLERLSCETASIIVGILTTHFLNQRFLDSIIPWFLQVVDFSSAHEPGDLVMSSKPQMEFLYALRQVAAMECIDRVDRISIAECAAKLSELWDEAPYRFA